MYESLIVSPRHDHRNGKNNKNKVEFIVLLRRFCVLTVCSVQLNCALFSKSGNFQVSPLGGGRELGEKKKVVKRIMQEKM